MGGGGYFGGGQTSDPQDHGGGGGGGEGPTPPPVTPPPITPPPITPPVTPTRDPKEEKRKICDAIMDSIKNANSKTKSYLDQLGKYSEYRDRYTGRLDENSFKSAFGNFASEVVDVALNMIPGEAGSLVGIAKYIGYDAPINLRDGTIALIQRDNGMAIQNYAGAGLNFTTSVIAGGGYKLLGRGFASVGLAVAIGIVGIKGYQELAPYFKEEGLRSQTLNQIDSYSGFLNNLAQDSSNFESLLGKQWAANGCNDL